MKKKSTRHPSYLMKSLTVRRVPRSSVMEGWGSLLSFWDADPVYAIADDPDLADWNAIRSDWTAVGDDLIAAAQSLKGQ